MRYIPSQIFELGGFVYARLARQLRKDRGLTQREVARAAGDLPKLLRLHRDCGGGRRKSTCPLAKIAGVFQVPLMALVDIETSAAEDMEKKPGERS